MTNCLKRYWIIFKDYFHRIYSRVESSPVIPSENIARFVMSSNYYSVSKRIVKPGAFLPKDSERQISVYRIYNLTEYEIWKIGEEKVAKPGRRNLYGRADIIAKIALDQGLRIVPDNRRDRHANVTDGPEEKSKRLQIAQELAKKALLTIKSD